MKNRFLLDTQAFILAAQAELSLPREIRAILLNHKNTLFLSLVSLWEMQIKLGLRKLHLPVSLSQALQRGVSDLGLELLPIKPEHI